MKKTKQTTLDKFGLESDKKMPVYKPRIFTADDLNRPFKLEPQADSPLSKPRPLFDSKPFFTPRKPEKKEEKKEEEEPYWSAEEWETWAMEIYKSYPDARQYLPKWLIDAVEHK